MRPRVSFSAVATALNNARDRDVKGCRAHGAAALELATRTATTRATEPVRQAVSRELQDVLR